MRPYIASMGTKRLPKGENTAGLNPDGTLAIGTPDEMRPLMEQWKRWQEMYTRGEWPDEPIVTVKSALARSNKSTTVHLRSKEAKP